MAYKQTMGKGPAMKTGAGIPKELMSGPAMHEGVVHEGKKPKGTTTRTQEKVTQGNQTGTLTTWTTRTPGSGGDSLSGEIIRTPAGDAAYAALDQAGRNAQDAKFKALNPRVPGSTNISSRFLADPMKPLTKPVIPGKVNIKGEGIKQGISFTPPPTKTTTGGGGGGGGNGGGGGGNGGGGGFGDVVETIGDVVGTVGKFVSKALKPKRKRGNRALRRTLGTHIGNFFRSCKGGC
jgi:hypothetical protein